jgi:palmitoyl-protein thioesterase
MGSIKKLIEDKLGVFVHSIATGAGEYQDVWSSFYGNVNQQVGKVCDELASMDELRGGFNMIGFSQGGQFLRAVVQRCGHRLPRVHSLITLGGQHQGVANTPGCSVDLTGAAAKACTAMQLLLARGAYAPWVRENIVQAQYFKDPLQIDSYLRYNIFLPDINNEREDKNANYADNLAALQRLVLFRFEEDTTVVPRDSAWFSFWDGAETVVPLKDQPLYQEDWLGLKRLDEAGGLVFESAPGEHMQFTLKWFEEKVVDVYLA